MIFQGQGTLPLIRSCLEKEGTLDNWQLNRGDFSTLSVKDRQFDKLSCERAVIREGEWDNCRFFLPEFRQCSLEGSAYNRCRLEEVLFLSCQMRETRWTDTELTGGVFRGCSAPRMLMDRCRIRRFSLHEPEISRGHFTRLAVVASLFTAAHESGITGIRKSEVEESLFINCRFTGTFFISSSLRNCVFIGCRFIDADWNLIEWEECYFMDCTGLPRGVGHNALNGGGSAGKVYEKWNHFSKELLDE